MQADWRPALQATNAVTQPLVPLYAIDNITDGSPQTSTSLTQPAAENRILVQFNTPSPNATAPSEPGLCVCNVPPDAMCWQACVHTCHSQLQAHYAKSARFGRTMYVHWRPVCCRDSCVPSILQGLSVQHYA